jgi:catechol 2,3-dioxygenase-like lactoylglutathione lyase family enzyme
MGEMKYMGIGQIAINVDDLDAAVADYTEVFGIAFTILDVTEINSRVAVSDGGIVFAEPLDKSQPINIRKYHNGALSALEVRVSDLEEAKRRLMAKGIDPVYYLDTPGGLTEYYMHQFHGVPLTIFQMDTESWVESIGGDELDPETYQPNIRWEVDH